jgi:hypothetical protein
MDKTVHRSEEKNGMGKQEICEYAGWSRQLVRYAGNIVEYHREPELDAGVFRQLGNMISDIFIHFVKIA